MSTRRKQGLNLLVAAAEGTIVFLFFISRVAMSVSQSALLSSASEVEVGWRAAAAAAAAGNNPPVIEIYILNSWLHNHFLHIFKYSKFAAAKKQCYSSHTNFKNVKKTLVSCGIRMLLGDLFAENKIKLLIKP